jgi:hypothetical protein
MLRAIKAVLWAFLGVRKQSEYEVDAARVNPFQLIVAGGVLALLFVMALIFLVRTISPGKPVVHKPPRVKTASVALQNQSHAKLAALSKTIQTHPHSGDFRG